MIPPPCHYNGRVSTLRDLSLSSYSPPPQLHSSIFSFPWCVEPNLHPFPTCGEAASEFGHGGPLSNQIGRYNDSSLLIYFVVYRCFILVLFSNHLMHLVFSPMTLPFCPLDGREVHSTCSQGFSLEILHGNECFSIFWVQISARISILLFAHSNSICWAIHCNHNNWFSGTT